MGQVGPPLDSTFARPFGVVREAEDPGSPTHEEFRLPFKLNFKLGKKMEGVVTVATMP